MSADNVKRRRVGLGLTDFAFNGLATPNIARTLFGLTWLALLLAFLILLALGIYYLAFTPGLWRVLGIILIIIAPIILFVGLMIVRIVLEVPVMLYRIEANTRS